MALGVLLAAPLFLQGAEGPRQPKPLEEQVRHELAMLPYYNVFDNLSFKLEGNTVMLMGDVTDPVLKSDAGNVVKRIPGIESVKNEINVLPLSPMDNAIRVRTYYALYRDPVLSRYALGPNPAIHIIVDNGNVTLDGVVSSPMEKQVAYMNASSVPGVFSVTNNIQVNRG